MQKRDQVEPEDHVLPQPQSSLTRPEYFIYVNFTWKLVKDLGSSSRMSQENQRCRERLCGLEIHKVKDSSNHGIDFRTSIKRCLQGSEWAQGRVISLHVLSQNEQNMPAILSQKYENVNNLKHNSNMKMIYSYLIKK